MKNIRFIIFLVLVLFIISCNKDKEEINGEFEFINEYTATVTVGGFVGVNERTFEVDEIYNGTDNGGETILIKIAEHNELNQDCPNSWCYQEFLDVPREFLRLVQ